MILIRELRWLSEETGGKWFRFLTLFNFFFPFWFFFDLRVWHLLDVFLDISRCRAGAFWICIPFPTCTSTSTGIKQKAHFKSIDI